MDRLLHTLQTTERCGRCHTLLKEKRLAPNLNGDVFPLCGACFNKDSALKRQLLAAQARAEIMAQEDEQFLSAVSRITKKPAVPLPKNLRKKGL